MSGGMPMMLLVVGILGAGAILFMKRCELLGICDDQVAPLPPPPPPAPAEDEDEDEDEEKDEDGQPINQTVIINAQGEREYVPYPVPVGRPRPVIVHPYPYPAPVPVRCSSSIRRHGVSYTLTSLKRMPDFQIAIYPPNYIQEGRCIYQRTSLPRPIPPRPEPLPKPVEITKGCCKCKTTGRDNEVRCSHDGGKTWSVNQRYRYDLQKSLNECVKKCRVLPTPSPLPWPFPIPGMDNDRKCTDSYCKQYPSRCPHCTQKSNFGSLAAYSNRMSLG